MWCKLLTLSLTSKWPFLIYFMLMDILMSASRLKDLFRVIVCHFSAETLSCVSIYLEKNVFCMVALVFNDFVVIIMMQFLPPVHQKLVPCDICFLITESLIVLSVHVNYCKRWHQMIRHCIYWEKNYNISVVSSPEFVTYWRKPS